jgi:hypothetical protein
MMNFSPDFIEQNGYQVKVLKGNDEDRHAEVFVAVARTSRQLENLIADLIEEVDGEKLSDYLPSLKDGLPDGKMVVILFLQNTYWTPHDGLSAISFQNSCLKSTLYQGDDIKDDMYANVFPLKTKIDTDIKFISRFPKKPPQQSPYSEYGFSPSKLIH